MRNVKTAVSISAYNRPEYFKQVVESLEKNLESSFLDFYFFLDGGQESAQQENAKIITNSSIANKHIIARHNNWGLGRNMIDVRRILFDVCRYDQVLVLEDDMVLSPQYIGLVFRILDWAETNFDDVGVAQGWSRCLWSKEQKFAHLDKVCVGNEHWWGYAMSRKVWDDIKLFLYEYEDMFLKDRPYAKRNNNAIREFYKKVFVERGRKERGLKKWPQNWDIRPGFLTPHAATGQDASTAIAVWISGYNKINTLVNRGLAIGKYGVHFREPQFKQMGLDKVALDVFETDRELGTFFPSDPKGNVLDKSDRESQSEKKQELIYLGSESKLTLKVATSTTKDNKDLLKVNFETNDNCFVNANKLECQGKLEEAIAEYRHSIKINPNFAWTHYELGDALVKSGSIKEAIAEYRRAVELNPNSVWFYFELAVTLYQNGQFYEAFRYYKPVKKIIYTYQNLYPERYKSFETNDNCFVNANKLECQGRLEEAIAEYRHSIKINPNFAWTHYELGDALVKSGSIKEAIAEYRRAVELNPNSVWFYFELAVTLYQDGQFYEAFRYYKPVKKIIYTYQNLYPERYKSLVSSQLNQTKYL